MARPLPNLASVANISPVNLTSVMNVCTAGEREYWDTLSTVLHEAEKKGAYEIHLEPEFDFLRLRLRSPFEFTETRIENSEPYLQALALLQRCIWDEEVSETARRGWFTFTMSSAASLFQLDVVPSSLGATFLVTLLEDFRKQPARLEDIGLGRAQLSNLKEALSKKSGLVIIAGDLAQARIRTSRAIAQALVAPDMKVIMSDNPMHPVIPRTTQLGMDFPPTDLQRNTWNAMCRLGADAIVATQTLEESAARQLISYASEQTLVVQTIRASTAVDCLSYLLGLGIRSETLAHTLSSLIIQHRVQCLCPYCRTAAAPDDEGTAWLAKYSPIQANNVNDWLRHRMRSSFSEAAGCDKCDASGYANWLDIFDVLTFCDEVKDALYDADYRYAFSQIKQQQSLGRQLLKLAQEGIIPLSEAIRITRLEMDG
ncbi:ATPase, T2SS/T4P/T4SS family [Granulosicoccus antarcticus]|uniref:Type II secretion system protein E n=1 Tax=Granulosicoccus antarcticus IMCC3135 TaxID=1192854 RepID=A0A2Z2NMC7_9GAMM|nr:ATPase, T2SS/T4P/T4SS family [Granulosicoccus antarcticus]ASJ71685.1 Type II secretion system protein E [Granulosicoccus antarcticus IMCC3135]